MNKMAKTLSAFATAGVVGRAPTQVRGAFVCASGSRLPARVARRVSARMTLTDEGGLDGMGSAESVQEEVATEESKLFVGNLSWETTDHSLGDAFSRYGTVVAARVVTDRFTGKSRGFGFIEYETANCANDALEGMNGFEVDGRKIRVDRANKRPPRPRREQY